MFRSRYAPRGRRGYAPRPSLRRSYARPARSSYSAGPRAYGYRARGYSSRSGYAARRLYIGGRRY